jgi:hypothetical protein
VYLQNGGWPVYLQNGGWPVYLQNGGWPVYIQNGGWPVYLQNLSISSLLPANHRNLHFPKFSPRRLYCALLLSLYY